LREHIPYAQMAQRAKPKLFKSGKRKGQVRVPGIFGLPFTREQFWQHALKQVGPGVTRCEYCVEIGRPAGLITLANCVFDHKVPLNRGGTWELENLKAVCASCNNEKGHLSYEFFVGLTCAIERWPDAKDRSAILSCMRTHGVTQRIRFEAKKPKKSEESSPAMESAALLQLEEAF
jgi:hypothetical protein